MNHLTAHDLTVMFFALAVLLGAAKLSGELTHKLGQPSILGEIFAGILLGPTVLGHFRPEWYAALFPSTGPIPIVLESVATLGVVFFLLAAGLETSLRSIFRQGRSALFVSFFGVIFPFATGFLAANFFPRFLGADPGANRLIFALFVGTALSISALPVIARTLMDLGLLQTEMGAVVMSSAMFDDLVGWILFGVVLGMMGAAGNSTGAAGSSMGGSMTAPTVSTAWRTIVLVLLFVTVTLTVGRWLIAKILRFIQTHTSGRGAVLGLIFTLTLAAAGFAEYAGIHAIFGAFIVAIAIGDALGAPPKHVVIPIKHSVIPSEAEEPASPRGEAADWGAITTDIRQIVTNVFAPFFFASIGLRTNFAASFSLGSHSHPHRRRLPGKNSRRQLGSAPGRHGRPLVLGRRPGHERPRRHGNYSRRPRPARRPDRRTHVRRSGGDGAVYIADFRAGDSGGDEK